LVLKITRETYRGKNLPEGLNPTPPYSCLELKQEFFVTREGPGILGD
jgi:hypothetical protein